MTPANELLSWIEADRDRIVGFLSDFLRARSPNPPGDTREAAAHLTALLDAEGLPYRTVGAREDLPNLLGTLHGSGPGRHLVLNGHMDTFPAIEDLPGERSQWSGDVEDGRIYGRWAADMKCGTTASLFTYLYLSRLRAEWRGRLTLTVVSDEETGGRWGTRHLMETIPEEVVGDACLNGEPSGVATVRFAEKGTIRAAITIRTAGGELDGVLRQVGIRGRRKINGFADDCALAGEVREPPGLDRARVLALLRAIVGRYPATMALREDHSYDASLCDPEGDLGVIVQDNVERLRGVRPPMIVSLGGSDARYWRWRGVPAYLYGPSPRTMGRRDEHVTVDEMLHVLRVPALSALDYLSR